MTADLFIKDARVVRPDALVDCGLVIREGRVVAVLAPGETAVITLALPLPSDFDLTLGQLDVQGGGLP